MKALMVATTLIGSLAILLSETCAAFVVPTCCQQLGGLHATKPDSTDAFSAFAETLEDNNKFDFENEEEKPWQASLEELLDPATNLARRQILLSDLLSANEEIRSSVLAALRDRKIDPLLTPTGKKLQDGTRAVARQITNDILPGIAAAKPTPIPADLPSLLPKVTSRIFNAMASQAKQNLETLQGDLQDPSRIPKRLTKQIETVSQEARNVFSETPEGLEGPPYTKVGEGEGYEIRQYEGYTVASTNMAKVGESFTMDDLASGGAAFNTLAAYLFGANDEGKTMAMTTPVSTTSLGEMRFYLKQDGSIETTSFPKPLEKDDNNVLYEKGAVQIVHIPPARLAVARFPGFVTEGEVSRQKDALLTRLACDGIEIDVAHGAVVPHVVFQYNPPYTIPVVRRNEIAVPVRVEEEMEASNANLEKEWIAENEEADDVSPSDS